MNSNKMIKTLKRWMLLLLTLPILWACDSSNNEAGPGMVSLSLTDGPLEAENVAAVYITITGIEYKQDSAWIEFEDFEGPQTINLLELTDGKTILLGEFFVDPGTVTGLRFHLDTSNDPELTTWIEFTDESTEPLKVPSGPQTGYKAVGNFDVPSNGGVQIVADFDVRKSVVKAGMSGMFILKPTIRVETIKLTGSISGEVTNIPPDTSVVVYAYRDGTYDEDTEADDPEEGAVRFPNAVTSDMVEDNTYTLSFLKAGTYDLVVAGFDAGDGSFLEVFGIVEDVEVQDDQETNQDINISDL